MTHAHQSSARPSMLDPSELADLPSPVLTVDLEAVRHNLATVCAWLPDGDLRHWRPHTKTLKIPRVLAELLRAGVRHFKCATLKEATVLLDVAQAEGVDTLDLLVAYPHVEPTLSLLGRLAAAHPQAQLSILCEHPDDVAAVPDLLGIFMDLNVGMDRTGLTPEAEPLLTALAEAVGDRLVGLHGYEGHVHTGPWAERRLAVHTALERLERARHGLHEAGFTIREVVTSGTPSFRAALEFAPFRRLPTTTVHRVSPGTVVYHDTRSADLEELRGLVWAVSVLARVISRPTSNRATVDAGSKALAADAGDPCAVVLGHPNLRALHPSEEHLPLDLDPNAPEGSSVPPRGTALWLVPRHVCPTVNLASQAFVVDGPRVLGWAQVTARGHGAVDIPEHPL
ncbi:MAG: alanine racemase [Myxococcota bacterium]